MILVQRSLLVLGLITLMQGCAGSKPSENGDISSRTLGIAFTPPHQWCTVGSRETTARYAFRPCGDTTTVIAVDRFSRKIELPDAESAAQEVLLPESLGEAWIARFVRELDFAVATIHDVGPLELAGHTAVGVVAGYRTPDGDPILVRTVLLPLPQGVVSLQLQRRDTGDQASVDAMFEAVVGSLQIR